MSPIPKKGGKKKSKSMTAKAVVPISTSAKSSAPNIRTRGTHTFSITRSEMVGTITNGATTGFAVTPMSYANDGYDLSATAAVMFPWLSGVAQRFERYRFRKLTLRLISSQPTTATGRVYIAFDPDWSDQVPITKPVLMGLAQAIDASVYGDVKFTVDLTNVNSSMPWRYCSPAGSRGGDEPRMTYGGFFVFGVDTPTANLAWDLWVDYEVDLVEPTSDTATEAYVYNTEEVTASPAAGKFWFTPTLSSLEGSSAKVVSCASVGIVPTINQPLCLQIAPNGVFKYTESHTRAGKSPLENANDYGPEINVAVHDAKGRWLGWASAVQHVNPMYGSQTSTWIGAAGNPLRLQMSVILADLLLAFPLAKYIIPYISHAADPAYTTRWSSLEMLTL